MSPAPLFRCTSMAAPITALLRRSAFSYNGCIRDTLTEGNEGNKRRNLEVKTLRCLRFLLFTFLHRHRRHPKLQIFTEDSNQTGLELDSQRFVTFVSFCLHFSY